MNANQALLLAAMKVVTVQNLPECTAQEVFDFVALNLLAQNRQSLAFCAETGGDVCVYRGNEGTKCAAGFIFNDEEAKVCEGKGWTYLAAASQSGESEMYGLTKIPADHANLISALQLIHDRSEPVEWPDRLRRLTKTQFVGPVPLNTINLDAFLNAAD